MTIDFDELTEGYNRIYNRNFKTTTEMLEILLFEMKSTVKIAEVLGISVVTLRNQFKKLNINYIQKRGGWWITRPSVLDGVEIEGRYPSDVAKEVGCDSALVYNYARKHNIEIKWVYRRREEE